MASKNSSIDFCLQHNRKLQRPMRNQEHHFCIASIGDCCRFSVTFSCTCSLDLSNTRRATTLKEITTAFPVDLVHRHFWTREAPWGSQFSYRQRLLVLVDGPQVTWLRETDCAWISPGAGKGHLLLGVLVDPLKVFRKQLMIGI